jgi:hypothetical protein
MPLIDCFQLALKKRVWRFRSDSQEHDWLLAKLPQKVIDC